MSFRPLIGLAAAQQSIAARDEALRNLNTAASRTPHSATDWINLAADLANSGMSMWQLRMMVAAINTRKDQPND